MTEEEKVPVKRKPSKEEKNEAAQIVLRLQESGDYSRLQEKLLVKILTEHPQWFDAMRQKTREVLQRKEGGILDVTLDELSTDLVPGGEKAVPEELKQAFLTHIQTSIQTAGASGRL